MMEVYDVGAGQSTESCSTWFKFYSSKAEHSLWSNGPPEDIPDIQTVLIVDDDNDSGTLKAIKLAHLGLDILLVYGDKAADHAIELSQYLPEDNSPDLILTDFNMPGMQGLDLSRVLRKQRPNCLIVCVTATSLADLSGGSDNESLHQQAIELGIPIRSSLDFMLETRNTLCGLITESVGMMKARARAS